MKRSAIRELTFRLIYSLEIQKVDELEEQVELYIQCNEIEENDAKEYIKDAILGINKNIVEMRTHDELIAKQGYYYNLYMSKEENKKSLKYCT